MVKNNFFKIILIGIGLGIFIKWFAIESFLIPTDSMSPTIEAGNIVWLNKIPLTDYKKNDIIAFEKDGENFIKRIVGMPQDTIFEGIFKIGKYSIFKSENLNEELPFYIIPKKSMTIQFSKENFDFYQPLLEKYENVQAGRIFDKIFINASESNTYTFKNNYYFVQGDNTEGSIDSRQWGLVSESHILGKVIYVQ